MRLFGRKDHPQESQGEERRRHPRITALLKITYQIGSDVLHPECRSEDISEGGVRVSLFQRLEIGTTLKLWISIQDEVEPVLVIGKVVRLRETPDREYPYEAGIEFDFFDSSLRSKIRHIIQIVSAKRG